MNTLIVPFLFIFCSGFAAVNYNEPKDFRSNVIQIKQDIQPEDSCYICDVPPSFGDRSENLMEFINNNLRYPLPEACYEGLVLVRFTVTGNGKIKDAHILKSLAPELDKEALRVVNSMPEWIPGIYKGKYSNCYYTIPITFRLNHKR